MSAMLDYEEALARLLAGAVPVTATETVATKEGEVLVYVLLSLLYKEEGDTEWNEVGPHYGGDIAVEMLKSERQQKNLDLNPDRKLLKLNIDAGGVRSRMSIDRAIARERAVAQPA